MKATILSCTADSSSPLFSRHLKAIKENTSGYQLIVFDNNREKGFNHAREINRAFSIARGDYLILLDDDLIVRGEWLDALIDAAQKNHAPVVGGTHRYQDGRINHSGGYLLPTGWAGHYLNPLTGDTFFPYVCSAVMLIDWKKCREWNLRFDENFNKYYQEADFCLRIWQKGGKVVSTPRCDVYHLVRQTMSQRNDHSSFGKDDIQYFREKWVDTRDLHHLLRRISADIGFGKPQQVALYHQLMQRYNDASARRSAPLFQEVYEASRDIRESEHGLKFAGGSCFHLGSLFAQQGKTADARLWLSRCLTYIPDHQKAAALLNAFTQQMETQ